MEFEERLNLLSLYRSYKEGYNSSVIYNQQGEDDKHGEKTLNALNYLESISFIQILVKGMGLTECRILPEGIKYVEENLLD